MLQELFSLAGRTALVTGASSGLGKHFAATLARAGAGVAARRIEPLAMGLDVTDSAAGFMTGSVLAVDGGHLVSTL